MARLLFKKKFKKCCRIVVMAVSLLLLLVGGYYIFYTIVEIIEDIKSDEELTSPKPSNHRSNNEENEKIFANYSQQIIKPFLNSLQGLENWIRDAEILEKLVSEEKLKSTKETEKLLADCQNFMLKELGVNWEPNQPLNEETLFEAYKEKKQEKTNEWKELKEQLDKILESLLNISDAYLNVRKENFEVRLCLREIILKFFQIAWQDNQHFIKYVKFSKTGEYCGFFGGQNIYYEHEIFFGLVEPNEELKFDDSHKKMFERLNKNLNS
jgi:hypothetical protein